MWPFTRRPKDPTRPAFAALFMERLKSAGENRPIAYDENEFSLRIGDDGARIYLRNHFDEFRAEKSEAGREAYLARVVRVHMKPPLASRPLAEVLPRLLPRFRERVFHEFLALQAQLEGKGILIPFRCHASDFAASLAIDNPESVESVADVHLKDWKVEFDRAMTTALENLGRRSGGAWEKPAPGVWASPWHDDHDAARVLLTDLIASLGTKGDPVATVPNQNLVLVTGAEDVEGLTVLARLTEEALKRPRAMSGAAMVLRDGAWSLYEPSPGLPAAASFRALRLRSRARDYAEQGGLLKAIFERKREDVFVASFMLLQDKATGALSTMTTWAEGVDSLLPECEAIAFGRMKGGKPVGAPVRVGWEVARRVMGEGMKAQGLFPERYRVAGFPTEEQMGEMGG